MRFLLVVLTVSVLLLISCSQKSNIRQEQTPYNPSMKKIYKIMASSKSHTSGKSIDFGSIEKVYQTNFSNLVKTYGQNMDAKISLALQKGKKGESPGVQKQWVEKGLQQVIYHTALAELDKAESGQMNVDKVADLLACLEPAVARRAKWLNVGSQLQDQINFEIAALRNASPKQSKTHAQNIKSVFTKVYLLCVLWETRGLVAARVVSKIE